MKWQDQGWEFVSENRGKLRTELNFRRVKAKTVGTYFRSLLATARRSQPPTLLLLAVSGSLLLAAGTVVTVVSAERGGDTPTPRTASTALPAASAVTDITVDDLLDKLNSSEGGISVGDRFRVTGELFESDIWGTGKSGDFFVFLKAKGGADDLSVFVNETDADDWQDGTTVEMVVKMVERTIDGETTDRWLEAQSAKIVSGGSA